MTRISPVRSPWCKTCPRWLKQKSSRQPAMNGKLNCNPRHGKAKCGMKASVMYFKPTTPRRISATKHELATPRYGPSRKEERLAKSCKLVQRRRLLNLRPSTALYPSGSDFEQQGTLEDAWRSCCHCRGPSSLHTRTDEVVSALLCTRHFKWRQRSYSRLPVRECELLVAEEVVERASKAEASGASSYTSAVLRQH